MRKNIFAYTPVIDTPPYLSINAEENGEITIHVRGLSLPLDDDKREQLVRLSFLATNQAEASITLSLLEINKLACALASFVVTASLKAVP